MADITKPGDTQSEIAEEVDIGEPLSQDAEIWAGMGKKLLEESIEVSREYAKFMIQFSLSAIPIYISLLSLVSKSTILVKNLGLSKALATLSPVILFIISSVMFILAYYPKSSKIHINIIESIQIAHKKLFNSRRRMNLIATSVFVIAVLLAAGILLTLI